VPQVVEVEPPEISARRPGSTVAAARLIVLANTSARKLSEFPTLSERGDGKTSPCELGRRARSCTLRRRRAHPRRRLAQRSAGDGRDESFRPGFRSTVEVHRRDQVDQQATGEEVDDPVRANTRDSLDEGDQLAVPGADDLANFRIVEGARFLQAGEQPRSGAELLDVAGCDRLECKPPTLAGGCVLERF
jgi:hypothetical protein